jgi:hypothetical protein
MGESLDLATVLPGTWRVAATNFPMWLDGTKLGPRFGYEVLGTDPLVLSDTVSYRDAAGEEHTILGRDTWRRDGFVWRGAGLLRVARSRWTVTGASDDDSLLAIRFERSLFTPAGVDIIAREDSPHEEPRRIVAADIEAFGLTPEAFASLSWLAPVPAR